MKLPIILSILLVFAAFSVYAQEMPPATHRFYGTVTNAEEGAIVEAKINEQFVASTPVTNSKYGYPPNTFKLTGTDGNTIKFYINEQQVGSATFQSFEVTELNLQAPQPAVSQPSGGGGGSAAGVNSYYPQSSGGYVGRKSVGGNVYISKNVSCWDRWDCTEWGDCVGAGRQRTCTFIDDPACSETVIQPPNTDVCTVAKVATPFVERPAPTPPSAQPPAKQPAAALPKEAPKEEKPSLIWLWFSLIIIAIIGAGTIGYLLYSRKKVPNGKEVEEIKKYADSALKAGETVEEVRQNLLKAGWPEELVSKGLSKYKK